MSAAPTPAQSDETRQDMFDFLKKYRANYGLDDDDLMRHVDDYVAAERQRIYAAVEEAIDKSRQTRKVISPKMISIYEEEFVTTAELRAAIKRLREGA